MDATLPAAHLAAQYADNAVSKARF